ncbi:haloalkane dehalogenase [Pseudoalteromonas denitrificans DSM 6059]|uniref:Haloalkane dehalogenase n=1 Tax=Pseudoalteromonas denitrificans DSM 6059 TaxID=1123010 RepID=A0A1I1TTC5_9GAMM|nr:haloalkane dehalogenase [Pseudoalteromonas denitrificans DSM 6059]
MVFLHGNPTSSYLWRNIIPYVSKNYRVIAPDFIGMGDSAKPDLKYTYADQAKYLHGFLDSLDLQNAILVLHDWGAALGFHYARTHSERISGMAFMEATLPPYYPIPSLEAMGPSAEFLKNVRTAGIGEEMVLKNNVLIDQFLRYSNHEKPLSDAVIAQYNHYFPTEKSRQALLQWLREIPINGSPANVHELGIKNNKWILESEIPKLLFYISPGVLVNEATVKYMQKNAKNIETIGLGSAGHFLQEVYSDEIGQGLADWLVTKNLH